MDQLFDNLHECGIIPVVKIDNANDATGLAEALIRGGLPCMEITFRTSAAEESIRRVTSSFPDFITGAGTVISVEQAEKAVKAGARFIVSPGFGPKVVSWCLKHQVPVFPGVATPTDILMALDKGLNILKFFPADAFGGIKTLQALSAPFDGVKFIPTGGINAQNLSEYLRLPSVFAVGGSWIVAAKLISAGKFDEIEWLVREALTLIKAARQGGG
jgi:2-dehydro-3-deoxyphosphogluconate aldolase/(4S)-4-hydroxy-2-oxoglutarate aldolase